LRGIFPPHVQPGFTTAGEWNVAARIYLLHRSDHTDHDNTQLHFRSGRLAVYFATPTRLRNPILLVINLRFYAFHSGWLAWILVFSIVLNHAAAKLLAWAHGGAKSAVFVGSIAANLALLFHYKYTGFLWDAVTQILAPLDIKMGHAPSVVLPTGISFFTFQALSYVAGVYTGRVAPARRLVDFGMYHS
jgi:alginate O-acetyltransferase complex protein AlgI